MRGIVFQFPTGSLSGPVFYALDDVLPWCGCVVLVPMCGPGVDLLPCGPICCPAVDVVTCGRCGDLVPDGATSRAPPVGRGPVGERPTSAPP